MHHKGTAEDKDFCYAKDGRNGLLSFIKEMIQKWMPYADAGEKLDTYLKGYEISMR